MMTLSDAIRHCNEYIESHDACDECTKEHEQLASWLIELQYIYELEAEGRLLRAPAAAGDTLVEPDPEGDSYHKVLAVNVEVVTDHGTFRAEDIGHIVYLDSVGRGISNVKL